MEGIQQKQKAISESLRSDLGKTYTEGSQEYISFQLQIMRSLNQRSLSNYERLKSEITLVTKSPTCFLLSTHVLAIDAHRCRHTI
jgi:hypothetical protein